MLKQSLIAIVLGSVSLFSQSPGQQSSPSISIARNYTNNITTIDVVTNKGNRSIQKTNILEREIDYSHGNERHNFFNYFIDGKNADDQLSELMMFRLGAITPALLPTMEFILVSLKSKKLSGQGNIRYFQTDMTMVEKIGRYSYPCQKEAVDKPFLAIKEALIPTRGDDGVAEIAFSKKLKKGHYALVRLNGLGSGVWAFDVE